MQIAHRGYSYAFKDNTMNAFTGALIYNFDMIEMDIQITKDNKIIVFHDVCISNLRGETNFIFEMYYSEIKNIDRDIPLLHEVLDTIGEEIPIYLDIKGSDNIILPLVNLLDEYKHLDILVASFNILIIDRLHELRPNYNYGIISETMFTKDIITTFIERYKLKFFCFQWCSLDTDIIDYIKRNLVSVFVYTNSNDTILERIKTFDIDGIVTNYKFR